MEKHNDDIAVDEFAEIMRSRMADKRDQGYCGWEDPKACTDVDLYQRAYRAWRNCQYVDLANYAMMLELRANKAAKG